MDSKQEPPTYTEAVSAPLVPNENPGFTPPTGDPGSHKPQTGYPAGPTQSPSYGQPAGGYNQPPQPGYYPYPQPQGYAGGGAGGYGFPQQQQHQQTVVVSQPTGQPVMGVTSVPDHMGLAIFTTICCCWPLGLMAIMRAQESRRALERGDVGAATTYSAEARRYSFWAIGGGCISLAIVIIFVIVYVTSVASTTYY